MECALDIFQPLHCIVDGKGVSMEPNQVVADFRFKNIFYFGIYNLSRICFKLFNHGKRSDKNNFYSQTQRRQYLLARKLIYFHYGSGDY